MKKTIAQKLRLALLMADGDDYCDRVPWAISMHTGIPVSTINRNFAQMMERGEVTRRRVTDELMVGGPPYAYYLTDDVVLCTACHDEVETQRAHFLSKDVSTTVSSPRID